MNFVFVSPHFPDIFWNFCDRLKKNGANVLAITDNPTWNLMPELQACITENYQVANMEDRNEMIKAIGYFTWKYGKIDWIESNNEYWLEMDADLRTQFNVTTGYNNDGITSIKSKEAMKPFYIAAGVPVARHHMVTNEKEGRKFIKKVGYPVIVKPNIGVGAADTYKLKNDEDVTWFYQNLPSCQYIMEEFIDGTICTYDGVCDSNSEVIFETGEVTPPVMDIVLDDTDLFYYTQKELPEALRKAGRATIKSFGVKSRFFHCEFFRLNTAKKGLGEVGDFVALEVNMRPAGGFTPDMINYSNSVDCYQIWADMVCFNEIRNVDMTQPHHYCCFAGRKDNKNYLHSTEEVFAKYGANIKYEREVPSAWRDVMGNRTFIATFDTEEELNEFNVYVHQKAEA